MKISVIGGGNVGATALLCIAQKELANELVLIDIVEGMPQGKALDILEARPVQGFDGKIYGSNDYAAIKDSDIIVMTAGVARKPGMSREDLLKTNQKIIEDAADKIKELAPNAIVIVVTNPLDIMTYLMYRRTGFEPKRVFGMAGVLDTARFKTFIAEELNVSVEDVSTIVLGGHGDNMVPLKRLTSVSGIPITELLPDDKIEAMIERTRKAGGEIVKLLKTGSAYYSPGISVTAMVEAVVKDKRRFLSASAYLNGEYGEKDVYCGVPVIVGKNGIEKVIEIKLTEEEKNWLNKSIETVRKGISSL